MRKAHLLNIGRQRPTVRCELELARMSLPGLRESGHPVPYLTILNMNANLPVFRAPTAGERIFNRIFGFLVGLGLGLPHNYLLQVRGRKTGKVYSTPIDLLEYGGRRFLVAPRGRTQWVRNAEVAGEVTLKKGIKRQQFRLRAIADADKPELLRAYLQAFKTAVQRYFPVPAGSPVESFAAISSAYPVFELIAR